MLWHEHNGNTTRVASICRVTRDTVAIHIARVAISLGFKSVTEAKKHFKYGKSSVSDGYQVNASDLKKLLEMQGYKCALTGVRLEPKSAELDHKVPLSRGGTNDLANLQWLSREVNRAKGTMDSDEFIALCKRVAKGYP